VGPVSSDKFEQGAIALAGKVGRLLDEVAGGRLENNGDLLSAHLVDIFRAILQAADVADVSLEEAVQKNVAKVTSRLAAQGQVLDAILQSGSAAVS
jgi:NTP pyrophosphatase (non-canonical NTP hydrolase)